MGGSEGNKYAYGTWFWSEDDLHTVPNTFNLKVLKEGCRSRHHISSLFSDLSVVMGKFNVAGKTCIEFCYAPVDLCKPMLEP